MYILKYNILTMFGDVILKNRTEQLPGSITDVASDYQLRESSAEDLGLKLDFISITKEA